MVENIREATSVVEVGEARAYGGQRLGFERARFYRIELREDEQPIFRGISQAGCHLHDFEPICEPVKGRGYRLVAEPGRSNLVQPW